MTKQERLIRGDSMVDAPMREIVLAMFPTPQYYIEAGAHNGIGDSQTLWLEERGWKGLLVEPSNAGAGLSENRNASWDRRAIYTKEGDAEWMELRGDHIELSGIDGHFWDPFWKRHEMPHTRKTVKTAMLATILRDHNAPKEIAFCCLDTEGCELEILLNHDFGQYNIRCLWLEYVGVQDRLDKILSAMAPLGYKSVRENGHDVLLVRNTL